LLRAAWCGGGAVGVNASGALFIGRPDTACCFCGTPARTAVTLESAPSVVRIATCERCATTIRDNLPPWIKTGMFNLAANLCDFMMDRSRPDGSGVPCLFWDLENKDLAVAFPPSVTGD